MIEGMPLSVPSMRWSALLRQVPAIALGLGIVVGDGRKAQCAKAYGQRKRSEAVAHLHLLAGLDTQARRAE
jgi:hypothetical protein